MISQISAPRLKGHRFPRSIISYAVWAYYRFSLSLRDVEDLLAERGIVVSYEAIRAWVGKFGPQIAKRVRATRPRPTDKWHLDEVVIMINAVQHWLWRRGQQRRSSRHPRANAPQCAGGEAFHFTADRPLG